MTGLLSSMLRRLPFPNASMRRRCVGPEQGKWRKSSRSRSSADCITSITALVDRCKRPKRPVPQCVPKARYSAVTLRKSFFQPPKSPASRLPAVHFQLLAARSDSAPLPEMAFSGGTAAGRERNNLGLPHMRIKTIYRHNLCSECKIPILSPFRSRRTSASL